MGHTANPAECGSDVNELDRGSVGFGTHSGLFPSSTMIVYILVFVAIDYRWETGCITAPRPPRWSNLKAPPFNFDLG